MIDAGYQDVPLAPSPYGERSYRAGRRLVEVHGVGLDEIVWDADEVLWDWVLVAGEVLRRLPRAALFRRYGHREHVVVRPGILELLFGMQHAARAAGRDPWVRIWTGGYPFRMAEILRAVPAFAALVGLPEGATDDPQVWADHPRVFTRVDYGDAVRAWFDDAGALREGLSDEVQAAISRQFARRPDDATFKLPEMASWVGKAGFDATSIIVDDRRSTVARFASTGRRGVVVVSDTPRILAGSVPHTVWRSDEGTLAALERDYTTGIAEALEQLAHAEGGTMIEARASRAVRDHAPVRFHVEIPSEVIDREWHGPMDIIRAASDTPREPRRRRDAVPLRRLAFGWLASAPERVVRLLAGRPRRAMGQTLDPVMQIGLRVAEATDGVNLDGLTPAAARRRSAKIERDVAGPIIPMSQVIDLRIPGADGPIAGRWYVPHPQRGAPSPALVYFHGGGFVVGSIDTHDNLCRILARRMRIPVLSVGYRLAPEARFPAAVDDALAAFRWAVQKASVHHIDPRRVAVGGDSAGGNLAAVVAHLTRTDAIKPAAQLLFYPGVDSLQRRDNPSYKVFSAGYGLDADTLEWFSSHYRRDDRDRADPRYSPLHTEDKSGLGPTYLVTAGFDPLRDEGREYAEALRDAGCEVAYACASSLLHGFATMAGRHKPSRRAVEAAADVVSGWLDRSDRQRSGYPPIAGDGGGASPSMVV